MSLERSQRKTRRSQTVTGRQHGNATPRDEHLDGPCIVAPNVKDGADIANDTTVDGDLKWSVTVMHDAELRFPLDESHGA